MKKNTIKINESTLRKIVKENLKRALREGEDWDWDQPVQWIKPRPSTKHVDYNQELRPGFYVCEEGNAGDVRVWTTNNLEEVKQVLSASESAVFGPYTKMRAFDFAVNEVNDNKGFDFDDEWVYREFNDPADIEYYYTNEKWDEKDARRMQGNSLKESRLRKIVAESVKKVLKEDMMDTPYFLDKVIKKANALKMEIYKAYDECDYGAYDEQQPAPQNGLRNPHGYEGADGEVEQLLYNAYGSVDEVIANLTAAKEKYVKEMGL